MKFQSKISYLGRKICILPWQMAEQLAGGGGGGIPGIQIIQKYLTRFLKYFTPKSMCQSVSQ